MPWPKKTPHGPWLALALAIACPFAGAESARAGAWVQPEGGAYVKASWLHLDTADRRSCRGTLEAVDPLGGRFAEEQFFVYGEWGATSRLTVLGSWSWKDQRITEATIPEYGTRSTGDLKLGGRAALFTGRFPVSLEAQLALPTYPATDLTRPVADREQFLPAGSGKVESELRAQMGWSLWPLPAYANLDIGYQWKGGAFGDQWLVATEVGSSSDRVFLKVGAQWRLPTGEVCSSSSVGNVSFHERSLRAGPEIGLRVYGSTWLYLGYTQLVSGRNSLDGAQWGLGLGWQRQDG